MSESNAGSASPASLAEVKAAAEDLLARATGPDIADSELFPYGVNRVVISVSAGDIDIHVEISGPDHAHEIDDEGEWLEDVNGAFDGED
jgi:hypothetical protein